MPPPETHPRFRRAPVRQRSGWFRWMKLVNNVAPRAFAECGQHNHRRDTQGHGQNDEQRAGSVTRYCFKRETQRVVQLHTRG